ncbi:hypothetical protein PV-S19_0358 [Pacmanvirus S19]|nr:hypothetical protein PV-S19_0358 [Pacmanvirus S19]
MSEELALAAMKTIEEISYGKFTIMDIPVKGKTTVELIHIFRMLRYNTKIIQYQIAHGGRSVEHVIQICKDIVKDLIDIRDSTPTETKTVDNLLGDF